MPRQHDQLLELRSNPKGEHEGEDPPKEVGSYETMTLLRAFPHLFQLSSDQQKMCQICAHMIMCMITVWSWLKLVASGRMVNFDELCPWQAEVKVTIEARLVAQRSNTSK